ncbi:hypothetical protein FQN57_002917 [Myotisia sp. PD_48]|nr:hypothetical protein FQN57_002917 [Myotisia sp. PD_48]
MPPRLHLQAVKALHSLQSDSRLLPNASVSLSRTARRLASDASSLPLIIGSQLLSPASQPPSHRRPEYRKSQLHRQYASILRTMPLILFFQHNNLQSMEWAYIRRELTNALRKVDGDKLAAGHTDPPLGGLIKLQIIQTHIFEASLRVVDFYRPESTSPHGNTQLTHDLSRAAYEAVLDKRGSHDFSPLLIGPIAMLSFPYVSPEHLKAALTILSPKAPDFPAPRRKANPGYYDLITQSGLQKLLLLGARVEGKIFDETEARWIGGIQGGMNGLRSQLVAMLQGVGAGLTNTLDSASKNLYLTLESRKTAMEEEQKDNKSNSA